MVVVFYCVQSHIEPRILVDLVVLGVVIEDLLELFVLGSCDEIYRNIQLFMEVRRGQYLLLYYFGVVNKHLCYFSFVDTDLPRRAKSHKELHTILVLSSVAKEVIEDNHTTS